jgi:hypothetical protein
MVQNDGTKPVSCASPCERGGVALLTTYLQWIWVRGKAPAREDENTAEALDEGIGLCAYFHSCLALGSAAETQGRQWKRCRSA